MSAASEGLAETCPMPGRPSGTCTAITADAIFGDYIAENHQRFLVIARHRLSPDQAGLFRLTTRRSSFLMRPAFVVLGVSRLRPLEFVLGFCLPVAGHSPETSSVDRRSLDTTTYLCQENGRSPSPPRLRCHKRASASLREPHLLWLLPRATTGHAAAPPSSVMNWRRLIAAITRSPRRRWRAASGELQFRASALSSNSGPARIWKTGLPEGRPAFRL
jgi:hypothetical protein